MQDPSTMRLDCYQLSHHAVFSVRKINPLLAWNQIHTHGTSKKESVMKKMHVKGLKLFHSNHYIKMSLAIAISMNQ